MEEIKRELGLVEIIVRTFKIYRSNFLYICAIVALINIPIIIINLFLPTISTSPTKEEIIGQLSTLVPLLLVEGAIAVLGISGIILIAKNALDGEKISLSDIIKSSASRWFNMVITSTLSGVIILGFLLLLIIPGIIWGTYYCFVDNAVTIKGLRGMQALNYSKSLVEDRWWQVFGYTLVIGTLVFLTQKGLEQVFYFIPQIPITKVAVDSINNIIDSFSTIAYTVMFLNLNALKERQY